MFIARSNMFRTLVIATGLLVSCAGSLQALEPTEKWEGTIDYAATGGSFLEDLCQATSFGCVNGEFDGQGDHVTTVSAAYLDGVPEGAHILKAMLVWMGSIEHGVGAPDNEVSIIPPGGDPYPVVGVEADLEEVIYEGADVTDSPANYHYFTYRVEITDIIRDHSVTLGNPLNGAYTVEGFSAFDGEPYKLREAVLGGWSLILFFSNPGGAAKRLYYYTDFQAIRDDEVTLLPSGFEVPINATGKVTFFLGEGDQGIAGMGSTATHNERLSFNSVTLWNECNTQDNAYNSTVNTNIRNDEFPCRRDQYSIDLDTFGLTSPTHFDEGQSSAEITLSLGADLVLTNFLVLVIDTKLPDFDIPEEPEKTASVPSGGSLYPGEEFIYRIHVQNCGEDVAVNVRVIDELPYWVIYIPDSTVVLEPPNETPRPIPDLPDGIEPLRYGVDIAASMPPGPEYRRTVEFHIRLRTEDEGITKETIIENVAEIISGRGDVYFTNGGLPVRHSVSPYSREGTLRFSNGARHANSRWVLPGDLDTLAAHLTIKSLNGDASLSTLRFSPIVPVDGENFDPFMVSSADLYWDKNGNGLKDEEDTQLGETATPIANGIIGFSDFELFAQFGLNEEKHVMLLIDTADEAGTGAWVQHELLEENITVYGFTDGLPFTCSSLKIPSDDLDLGMELGIKTPAASHLPRGSEDVSVIQIKFRSFGREVTVSGLGINAEGTIYDPNDVVELKLVEDTNSDGYYSTGEPILADGGKFELDNGSVSFSNLGLTVLENGAKHVLVLASFSVDVKEDRSFRVNVLQNTDVIANTAEGDAAVDGAPIPGNYFTFAAGQVIECQSDEDCTGSMGPNWYCDHEAGICRSSITSDGDDDTDNGGDITPEKKSGGGGGGGGCGLTESGAPALFLIAFLIVVLMRRRRERR